MWLWYVFCCTVQISTSSSILYYNTLLSSVHIYAYITLSLLNDRSNSKFDFICSLYSVFLSSSYSFAKPFVCVCVSFFSPVYSTISRWLFRVSNNFYWFISCRWLFIHTYIFISFGLLIECNAHEIMIHFIIFVVGIFNFLFLSLSLCIGFYYNKPNITIWVVRECY